MMSQLTLAYFVRYSLIPNRQTHFALVSCLHNNIVLEKFQSRLNTCDLQFGFKSNSSTHNVYRPTMVLKETISYYVKHRSSVFCTFLDSSKAFDRVHHCKLFRLLIKRGIPVCFIRTLVYMYCGPSVRVGWYLIHLFSSAKRCETRRCY